jgi:hypothetical protein
MLVPYTSVTGVACPPTIGAARTSSGSFATFAAIRRASSREGWKQIIGIGVLSRTRVGAAMRVSIAQNKRAAWDVDRRLIFAPTPAGVETAIEASPIVVRNGFCRGRDPREWSICRNLLSWLDVQKPKERAA